MRKMRPSDYSKYVVILVAVVGVSYFFRHHSFHSAAKSGHDQRFAATEPGGSVANAETEIDDDGGRSPASLITDGNGVGADGVCASIEYRGGGLKHTHVSDADWHAVMTVYHGVKADLLGWLEQNKNQLNEKTYASMQTQIRNLRIQRPVLNTQPDLTWRGIGVMTLDEFGQPVIEMGSGLVKLISQNKMRGRFEMARLVAQSWAPCELTRVQGGEAWGPLLSCMDVEESNACGSRTYSEAGWAVSTVLAAKVADPGCVVPALQDDKIAACMKKIPLPKTVAQAW